MRTLLIQPDIHSENIIHVRSFIRIILQMSEIFAYFNALKELLTRVFAVFSDR